MARRYVRDKGGRFASKGGGSRGKGGKMGKSAKNVKARADYKNQSGKLREAKKMAGGKMTKSGGSREQKFWNRQLGGAKSGMTRVSNRLTKKGAAKARTGANKPGKLVPNANKLAQSKKYASARKAKKGSSERRDMVATARIRKGAKARSSYRPKQEAASARQRLIKKSKTKRMESGTFKAPKGKIGKAKRNPAKKMYKKAKSDLRFEKRVGYESGSKNTRGIKGSKKKIKDLENAFRNVKGRKN